MLPTGFFEVTSKDYPVSGIERLRVLREARELEYDRGQSAKRRRRVVAKVLFWILMSPMIAAIFAAMWGMHEVAGLSAG